jgi:signal transduction histidine kinase
MPRGGELRIRVQPQGREATPDTVEVVVEDTGVGIGENQMARVFEPFYTTKPTGTGLGLAIVHRIIEDHAGEIRVESEPGVGTRFTIIIPFEVK